MGSGGPLTTSNATACELGGRSRASRLDRTKENVLFHLLHENRVASP